MREEIIISGELIHRSLLHHKIAGYTSEQQPYAMAKWFVQKRCGWENLEFNEMIAKDVSNGNIAVCRR